MKDDIIFLKIRNQMGQFFKRFFAGKIEIETRYDKVEIKKFYAQLLKMKKKRPHINPIKLVRKCYPNTKFTIDEVIEEYESSVKS